ncbi:GNAT family acetyltransferase [Candidatus Neomarinimicrobiota bacterium]
MKIRPFEPRDTDEVVALWDRCDLIRPWNDPRLDIARKMRVDRDLFLVGELDDQVMVTAMVGYEGHRGWVNYLAVEPSVQRLGLGRRMMKRVEELLRERDCPKVNIQIRGTNVSAIMFYRQLGYDVDDVVNMGKRLEKHE